MTKPPPRKVAAIKEVVAADFNVTVDEIDGRVRTASIALARQVAMQLVREVLACSSTDIAAAFFRNHHGTVLHAFTAVKERIATDSFFASRMDKLRSLVATKLKEVAA